MKKIITTLILISSFGYLNAQVSIPICFTYDNAGNRIQRSTSCYGSSSLTRDETKMKILDSHEDEDNSELKKQEIVDISTIVVF